MSKDVRRKIIDAAAEAFSVYGYDKTTVEDIARMADKGKATVYYYFEGKAEILSEALEEEVRAMCDALSPYMAKTDPADMARNLGSYLKKRMDLLLASRLLMKFSAENLRRGSRSELGGIILNARKAFDDAEKQFFEAVCRFATASGALDSKVRPEIFAEMLSMVLRGVEVQMVLSGDKNDVRATYDEMVNFITNTDNYNI